jgi:hypothetical protein
VAACGLDLLWKLFDTASFFGSACFKYILNELNENLQLIHHKNMSKALFSFLRIRKVASRLGHKHRVSSGGYGGALLTFHKGV